LWVVVAVLTTAMLALLSAPAVSWGHAERATTFPDPNQGDFPQYRTTGPMVVVCAKDSSNRIRKISDSPLRRLNQHLLTRCRFHTIQDAVDYAQNNYRIEILPGVYRELPSLTPAPGGCESIYAQVAAGNGVISYDDERRCPNAKNLIAIMGDTNGNGLCDSKCNLQIEGTGEKPEDVIVEGDRFSGGSLRLNAIRADRADGVYLKNLTTEYFDFNGVYFLETNGFVLDNVVSRWNREYGVLSFTSDHGIYEYCETYGNGDSGVYPGSGPNGRHGQPDSHGHVYGILIHDCDSHDNLMGYSATAGNGTWSYHNRFHHNASGTVTDAIVPGHPGMPPDFSKWSENLYYSNNKPLFSNGPIPPGNYSDDTTTGRDEYCKLPPNQRDLRVVCPSFFMPIGTGLLLAGANSDIVENNYFWDNWRLGSGLLYVPATLRGENDPSRQSDVSNNNRTQGNCLGKRPAVIDPAQVDFSQCQGTADPNGVDLWWDIQEGTDCPELDQNSGSCVDATDGLGNCWSGNTGYQGTPSSDPALIQSTNACPGLDVAHPPDGSKSAFLVPCTLWDPQTNTDPAGCEMAGSSWFDVPAEPQP
jgi:hypothetical protein